MITELSSLDGLNIEEINKKREEHKKKVRKAAKKIQDFAKMKEELLGDTFTDMFEMFEKDIMKLLKKYPDNPSFTSWSIAYFIVYAEQMSEQLKDAPILQDCVKVIRDRSKILPLCDYKLGDADKLKKELENMFEVSNKDNKRTTDYVG